MPPPSVVPLPNDRRRGAAWWVLALTGGLISVVLILALSFNQSALVIIDVVVYGVFYSLPCLFGAAMMYRDRSRYLTFLDEQRQIAAGLGFTFYERVNTSLLDELENLPLIRLASDFTTRAGYCLQGSHASYQVSIFELEFQGRDLRPFRRCQTVLVLHNVGPLPTFAVQPAQNEWEDLIEGWRKLAGIGRPVLDLDTLAYEPSKLFARQVEEARALFCPARLRQLGSLSECSLEYRDGKLLFYSQDINIPPGGIPRALDRLIEIVQILLLPADQLSPAEPGESTFTSEPAPAPAPVPPEAIRTSPAPE
ncbi:MAG: hypothetical protein U0840_18910 [Gemmataceae bacterium]